MELAGVRFSFLGWLSQIAFFALLIATQPGVAHASINNEALERAVAKRVCFEAFWWGRSAFRFGKTVPLVVRTVGDRAYVWSESLSAVPHVKVWVNFFSVFSSGAVVTVGESQGFNADALAGTPIFKKYKALVYQGERSTMMFHVPSSCTPKFERSTRLKRSMLKVVEASVIQELTLYRKNGVSGLPSRLRIVIANFNPHDPATWVLVPSAGYLFYVALHLASNPLSNRFLRQGQYPVQREYNKTMIEAISRKIEKYGIVRDIRLPLN